MNRRESTRIAEPAPSRRRAYVARSTDRRARPPRVAVCDSRVVECARVAPSHNAVARCGPLLLLLRPRIRCIRHIMRTQITITKWIARVIVGVRLCVHTRVSECSRAPASLRRRIRHASTRSSDAMRAMRCVRHSIRGDSRRVRPRAASTGAPTVALSDRASIASRGRGADRAMDSRRRRRSTTPRRRRRASPRTRFEDSTSRARLEARNRTARRAKRGDARRRRGRAREGRADARETTRGGAEH